MNEMIVGISLASNLIIIGVLCFLLLKRKSDKQQVEVQYFEHIEEVEGAIRDSKKVTITGQIFIDGIPVGGQFFVAEKSFKKFDYEKLKEFKKEVVEPFAKTSLQVAQALNGLPDAAKTAKFIKSKIG
ncbi:hypothetical protein AZI85_17245 [Bdellovibrio bacteriovorus]|uniref:Uncharacterized protein n=1 Tax=Bdellovibrio bacteriovorus TaxID=959 RepID=A0A150WT68_BDEBC|nr:hypothetical protein [Bdellovibrio bacteriovorus]KYG67625.1 hypothetical protein AZI85_17245 [Bdellovibrio bacteriovorus]